MRERESVIDAVARFEALFAAHNAAVLAYLLRRTDRPEDAADLFADVFLVAWRRIGTIPRGDDARLWLYGVARKTFANYRRGERRRNDLADRLRESLTGPPVAPSPSNHVRDALNTLPAADRELLLLSAWEDLSPSQIASVAGLPGVVVRVRLHRARRRLKRLLTETVPSPFAGEQSFS